MWDGLPVQEYDTEGELSATLFPSANLLASHSVADATLYIV